MNYCSYCGTKIDSRKITSYQDPIRSDDPNALEKLKEKLSKLETIQEVLKSVNKIVRKKIEREEKIKQIVEIYNQLYGWSKEKATEEANGILDAGGYEHFWLSNNNQNMKSVRDRIAYLERHSEDETQEFEIGDVTVVDNVEDNRTQIFFPGKPSSEIRDQLKHNGFRWSPTNGCWQGSRKSYYLKVAKQIATDFNTKENLTSKYIKIGKCLESSKSSFANLDKGDEIYAVVSYNVGSEIKFFEKLSDAQKEYQKIIDARIKETREEFDFYFAQKISEEEIYEYAVEDLNIAVYKAKSDDIGVPLKEWFKTKRGPDNIDKDRFGYDLKFVEWIN